jgi:alkyldihydroxyacetonephosphate synthase
VLEWCSDQAIAVIPFGGGTSVVGGVEPSVPNGFSAVLSLDVRRLNGLLELDDVSRSARIQAGATGPQIEAALGARGFTLRHYPQSFEFSTLGGWIATRAAGHFATLKTRIDDLLESVRMLSPAGALESRRLPSSGAGPAPERLILGSEGTLGVITEAWLRVLPKPKWRARATVHFDSFRAGVEAARGLAQSGLHPSNCRLLDPAEAQLFGVSSDGTALLIVAFESADHPLEAWMEAALRLCRGSGGRVLREPKYGGPAETDAPEEAERWREAFFEAPYLQTALVSLGAIADTFETACTWERFDSLHQDVLQSVRATLERVAGGGRVTCRFTHVYPDGPAPYYTFLAPGRLGAELEQWAEIKRSASEAIQRNGGTITHHHAVGRVHRPWYSAECPPLHAQALWAVKSVLDPAGVLNPGALLPPRQRA